MYKAPCEKAAPMPSHTPTLGSSHAHMHTEEAGRFCHDAQGVERCPSLLVFELVGEPVQAFVEPVSAGGTSSLNVPVSLAEGM